VVSKNKTKGKRNRPPNNAYLNGEGVNSPLGIFVDSDLGIISGRDRETGTAETVKADDLIDAVSDLKAQYRRKCVWIASREFERRCRKLKSGDGAYLLVNSLASGVPNTLLGYPLHISGYAPSTWSSGEYMAILIDPKKYWIADQLSIQIQVFTELYAETNQNGYIFRMETDSAPIDELAAVRIKLK
jgi:HK97 family phage major capsid protein